MIKQIVVCTSHDQYKYTNLKHVKLIVDKEDHYEGMKKVNTVEDPFRQIVVCTSHDLSEFKNFKHIKLIAD